METVALVLLAVLAIGYVGYMVAFSIAMMPFGIIPLIGCAAMSLFFINSLQSKVGNAEDEKYNERCEP